MLAGLQVTGFLTSSMRNIWELWKHKFSSLILMEIWIQKILRGAKNAVCFVFTPQGDCSPSRTEHQTVRIPVWSPQLIWPSWETRNPCLAFISH